MAKPQCKVLEEARVLDPRNDRNSLGFADYERGNIQMFQPLTLPRESWAFVYVQGDYDTAENFVAMCKKAQGRMGMRFEEPQYVEIPAKRAKGSKDYLDAIKSEVNPKDVKIIVVMLQDPRDKAPIKKFIDEQGGVPS